MENASDALLIVFAVLVFVVALSVAMNSFNQVKITSDVVLAKSDITNFYEYQGATGKASQNRIVGLETIIPTLYSYYKENYTVLFRECTNYNQVTGEFNGVITPLKPGSIDGLYKTKSPYSTMKKGKTYYLWGKTDGSQSTYDTLMQKKYSQYFTNGYNKKGSQEIFSFDVEEETARHEPWTGSYEKTKENIDCFLKGDIYRNPSDNSAYIDYKTYLGLGGFIKKYQNAKFVETIGEYKKSSNQDLTSDLEDEYGQYGSTVGDLTAEKNNRTNYKRIVIFTLIK